MSESILGKRYLGPRQAPWTAIGTQFDQPGPACEALAKAHLDYVVDKREVYTQEITPFGTAMGLIPGKFALYRNPAPDVGGAPQYLSMVGSDYTIVQNMDFARMLDATLTELWPVENCGEFRNGRTLYFVLDAGEFAVKGDPVQLRFLATDFKTGGQAARVALIGHRIFCGNQIITSLRSSLVSAAMIHGSAVNVNLNSRLALIRALQKARATMIDTFNEFANTSIEQEQFQRIVENAFQYPNKPSRVFENEQLENAGLDSEVVQAFSDVVNRSMTAKQAWEYAVGRVDIFRSTAGTLYDRFNDQFPESARTLWAGLQACTEVSDWRDGADSVHESVLYGDRAKEKARAYQTCSALLSELKGA